MKEPSSGKAAASSQWPVTDWSDLARTAVSVGKEAERLEQLILRYQRPLRSYFLSVFPFLENESDEILQDFAQDKILKSGWLGRANRARGRFRDFLKSSLKNFVNDRLRKNANAPGSLDALLIDPPAEQQNDDLFDLNWLQQVLAETLRRMELECQRPVKNQLNRPRIWEVFRLRVVQPILGDQEPVGYGELVERCGIRSLFEAHSLLATGKRMFVRLFGQVIGEYEGRGAALREEVEHFRGFLARISSKKTR
jgi:DNA-directed RNA polymerase specialized sigma24 family protein